LRAELCRVLVFRITAVSQLPYTGTEIAEWLFHQEKATLENAGKCT
jgi:hypothetical protein